MYQLVVFKGDRPSQNSTAQLFVDQINKVAAEPLALCIAYKQLIFRFQNNTSSVVLAKTGEKLETLGREYYVRDYHGYQHERYALGAYLLQKGLPAFNSDITANETLSKLEQLMAYSAANIPTPNAFYAADPKLLRGLLPYPQVVKSITASNNQLNYLVHDDEEFEQAIKAIAYKTLAQEYIDNDGDYKVIIMYGKPVAIYKRSQENSYVTSGGRWHRDMVSDEDVAQLATRVAKCLGREFCGVDIVRERATNKLYVLECNFNAGMNLKGVDVVDALIPNTVELMKRRQHDPGKNLLKDT